MKKKWTELELIIVYYVVKHGVHGAVRNEETGKFLNEREIDLFLGHGLKSFLHCHDKFRFLLGLPQNSFPGVNPTKAQKAIVDKYANTTVSQLRLIIQRGLNELKSKSNDNVLEKKESSVGRRKPSSGEQLSLDFMDGSVF